MGRSVSYPSGATVAYAPISFRDDCGYEEQIECGQCEGTGDIPTNSALMEGDPEETEECPVCGGTGFIDNPEEPTYDYFDFDDLIDDFRQQVKDLFPSTYEMNDWLDREDHVLAANGHALFGISEYCGLVAYWVLPRPDAGCSWVCTEQTELSYRWVAQIGDRFTKHFGQLRKLGTASNGEAFFERAAA